jgi:uncharacterized protein (DUF433 family)
MVPSADLPNYVRADERQVLRIGESRVSLDSVVRAFQRGDSPESIQQQYPVLTLEQVYGAITHYLAHREEIDAYMETQQAVWDLERAKADASPSPVVQRLRKIKASQALAFEQNR